MACQANQDTANTHLNKINSINKDPSNPLKRQSLKDTRPHFVDTLRITDHAHLETAAHSLMAKTSSDKSQT